MAKAKKPAPSKMPLELKDEPGAEERFKDLVKRALVTPPSKKKPVGTKTKPSE